MGDDVNGPRAKTQLLDSGRFFENIDLQRAYEGADAKVAGFIAVIESHAFLREYIRRTMQSAFSLPIITYSAVSELERQPRISPDLVILSLIEASNEASIGSLEGFVGTASGSHGPCPRLCQRRGLGANRHPP